MNIGPLAAGIIMIVIGALFSFPGRQIVIAIGVIIVLVVLLA